MPYPNEHSARVRSPGDFQKDSFRRKKIADGVVIVMGRLKGKTTMTAQSYRFDKEKFTAAEARTWLKEHDVNHKSFEAVRKTAKMTGSDGEFALSLDDRMEMVRSAILERWPADYEKGRYPQIEDIYDDFAAVIIEGKLYRVPYTISDDGVELGEPEVAEKEYVSKESAQSPQFASMGDRHLAAEDVACFAVERTGLLFEAGEYADKGLPEVTPADLETYAANHTDPVPILVEHTPNPLNLGTLRHVFAKGNQLFGRVRMPDAAWSLVKESGAKKLSIALDRAKEKIRELSLVRSPRVASAALFSGAGEDVAVFECAISNFLSAGASCAGETDDQGGNQMPATSAPASVKNKAPAGGESPAKGAVTFTEEMQAEFNELRKEHKEAQAGLAKMREERDRDRIAQTLERLKRDGFLTPAGADRAEALLTAARGQVVTFKANGQGDDPDSKPEQKEFIEAFADVCRANGKVVLLGESTPGKGQKEGAARFSEEDTKDLSEDEKEALFTLTSAELEYAKKTGVTPAEYAQGKLRTREADGDTEEDED